MHRYARRLAVLAAAAAVTCTIPTAEAAHQATGDATGDVWTIDMESSSEEMIPADRQVNVDLVDVLVKHTPKTVRTVATYTDLVKGVKSEYFGFQMRTRDEQGRRFVADVFAGAPRPKGDPSLSRNSGRLIRCPGMAHTVDYSTNKVTLTVPRSCLGRPNRIQLQAAAVLVEETETTSNLYIDDARSANADPRGWSKFIRRG
jgi:hypothetical protein